VGPVNIRREHVLDNELDKVSPRCCRNGMLRPSLLGQVISADLGVAKHVSCAGATCFRVDCDSSDAHCPQSLTAACTLVVHATSRLDYCSVVCVAAPKSVTSSKLQRPGA